MLARHGLAGVFYRLSLEHPGLWPEALQRPLRNNYHSVLPWGDRCGGEVRTVLEALAEAGIDAIVLKGWALIPTVYRGDYGQRTYADVDLLVPAQDAARAEQLVLDLGYESTQEVWPGFSRRYGVSRSYQLPGDPGGFGQAFAVALH